MGNAKSKRGPIQGMGELLLPVVDSGKTFSIDVSDTHEWDAHVRSMLHGSVKMLSTASSTSRGAASLDSNEGQNDNGSNHSRSNGIRNNRKGWKNRKRWHRGHLCARIIGQEWVRLPKDLFSSRSRSPVRPLKSLQLCCHSRLTNLPNDFLSDLAWGTRLTCLDLSNNGLISLPFCLASLSSLQELTLSRNKLTRLPLFLTNIRNMKSLILDTNALERIDAALLVAWCASLKILDLSYNERLASLPIELLKCRNLSVLRVTGSFSLFTPREAAQPEGGVELLCPKQRLPLSLKEMTMRSLLASDEAFSLTSLPSSLKVGLIAELRVCSYCGHGYSLPFERLWFKWVDWMGVRIEGLPVGTESGLKLAYQLCSLHWRCESERILQLFQSNPELDRRKQLSAQARAKIHAVSKARAGAVAKPGADLGQLRWTLRDIDCLLLESHAATERSERTFLELLLQRNQA